MMPPLDPHQKKISSPLEVNVCSSNHISNDGLSTPTPITKFLNMPLGEQLFQVFDIMCKGKHPSHILEGFPRITFYSTIQLIQLLLLISLKFFLPKTSHKEWELN
jgi:hypothetical protein